MYNIIDLVLSGVVILGLGCFGLLILVGVATILDDWRNKKDD